MRHGSFLVSYSVIFMGCPCDRVTEVPWSPTGGGTGDDTPASDVVLTLTLVDVRATVFYKLYLFVNIEFAF